jgi:hypothetical protein
MQEAAQLTVGLCHCQNVASSSLSVRSLATPRRIRDVADAPIPSVVAMLVCDQVIAEQGTNKKSLIGVFELFWALAFPTIIPRISIYVKLADAFGEYHFKLRLVRLKDESLVAEIGIDADVKDSAHYSELALNMGNLPFPEPGKYEFQLYAGDVYLHRVTMQALLTQLPQGGPGWPQQPQ